MRAAIYRVKGRAADVLRIEELTPAEPDLGEVDYPIVVPHSDGAGTIEALGPLVISRRVGQRVWIFNAQWARAMGTAAQCVTLPAQFAVPLPDQVPFEVGASIGIPLMTAYHAIESCGSLFGRSVVVFGAAGSVGHYATQLARLGAARVIAIVSSDTKAQLATAAGADEVVNYRNEDVAARVRKLTGGQGADFIIDVDAAANARHYGDMLAFGGKVVIYGSGQALIPMPFRPLILGFGTLYFFIVYKLPPEVMRRTVEAVTGLLKRGALKHPRVEIHALEQIAAAHEQVEQGIGAKVLIEL
jgi:NADPH:quinone reductase